MKQFTVHEADQIGYEDDRLPPDAVLTRRALLICAAGLTGIGKFVKDQWADRQQSDNGGGATSVVEGSTPVWPEEVHDFDSGIFFEATPEAD